MTKEELIAAIAAMSKEERDALLGKAKKTTYKVVDVVRLYFTEKPDKETREQMQAAGFHWNSFQKYWWADATDAALKFVAERDIEEQK